MVVTWGARGGEKTPILKSRRTANPRVSLGSKSQKKDLCTFCRILCLSYHTMGTGADQS